MLKEIQIETDTPKNFLQLNERISIFENSPHQNNKHSSQQIPSIQSNLIIMLRRINQELGRNNRDLEMKLWNIGQFKQEKKKDDQNVNINMSNSYCDKININKSNLLTQQSIIQSIKKIKNNIRDSEIITHQWKIEDEHESNKGKFKKKKNKNKRYTVYHGLSSVHHLCKLSSYKNQY